MTTTDWLLDLLDLEVLDRDLYRAKVPTHWVGDRLFGGQVAAQALRAATLTVEPERRPHSLHSYFLRPGSPGTPLVLFVDRIRDGRSFTTRRVKAQQDGEAIFSLSASFHIDEDAEDEYQASLAPDVGDPDSVDVGHEGDGWGATELSTFTDQMPFDIRERAIPDRSADGSFPWTRRVWMRSKGRLPDDPAVHASVLTYASDMGAVFAASLAIGGRLGSHMGASLDHAVWFHRRTRFDEWVLYELRPVSVSGSRGYVQGSIHDRDGRLVASVVQESLLRRRR